MNCKRLQALAQIPGDESFPSFHHHPPVPGLDLEGDQLSPVTQPGSARMGKYNEDDPILGQLTGQHSVLARPHQGSLNKESHE